MTTAQDLIDRVQKKLNDIANVRWPVAEVLEAITDGQQAILEAKPDLFETSENFDVQAGTRQAVPAVCFLLLDVVELQLNGVFVSTPRRVKKSVMDRQIPGWVGAEEESQIEHWLQDDKERKFFYIYPATPVADQKLRLRFCKFPNKITATADELQVPDEHINALYYFCMMRCLEKDEKFSGSEQAQRFASMWGVAFTARTEGEATTDKDRTDNEGR